MSKIAYSTQGLIHVIDLENNQTQTYTQGKGMWNPSWSPDGKYIAYGWGVVNILELATGKITELAPGAAFPAFHPDGSTLIYNVNGEGLFAHHLPTGQITRILDNTLQPFQATWHPSGEMIAFVGQVGNDRHIFTLDLACLDDDSCAEAAVQITQNGRFNHAPAWSPDGQRIAFERMDFATGKWHIMVIDADGSNERQISPDDVSDHHPTWSADGQQLVVERETNQPGLRANLYLIDLKGNTIRQLTTTGGTEPEWWSAN
ncbi:MAG: hypothetical protein CUN56_09390 [Phototrophicales bacterium]|nr:MAG: hypothetical protein CUN56_09390 [Phototrophicales bacterium]RMG73201.1 MAG: hypothetical protein D6711_11355 [Chloroflexota bacterium]